ncbi:MAG: hypothetical protein KBD64_03570 [Gammaproteobacteria bacterium]|nr:hypothetical protein [Gammaproteobacteria bacterium]
MLQEDREADKLDREPLVAKPKSERSHLACCCKNFVLLPGSVLTALFICGLILFYALRKPTLIAIESLASAEIKTIDNNESISSVSESLCDKLHTYTNFSEPVCEQLSPKILHAILPHTPEIMSFLLDWSVLGRYITYGLVSYALMASVLFLAILLGIYKLLSSTSGFVVKKSLQLYESCKTPQATALIAMPSASPVYPPSRIGLLA